MKDTQAAAVQAVAWVVHAPNGNVRLWSHDQHEAARCADANGLTVTPLYAAPPSSLLEQAVKALALCEKNIVLIGNVCNEKHVSEAIMERAMEVQVECIDACRAALAALREALKENSDAR